MHTQPSSPEFQKLTTIVKDIFTLAADLMTIFNARKYRLKSLPPHKRIYLFFLTRSIKTFAAVETLCTTGYTQDMSTLLRSLLENLITVRYILYDVKSADQKAIRFVDYKWIIFKKYLPDPEEDPATIQDPLRKKLIDQKDLILEKIKEFKAKNNITSDKALITWSGRSIKDMGKMADKKLLSEYNSTFRLSSRFSHPSIIGDREYLHYEDDNLVFTPFTTSPHASENFKIATSYMIEFLKIYNDLFELEQTTRVDQLRRDLDQIPPTVPFSPPDATKKADLIVRFNTLLEPRNE